jgi:hypothetical protein
LRALTITAATIALAFTFALGAANAKEKRYELQLANSVTANGVQLQAGTYDVAVENSAVTFYRHNKEVAKVPVRVEDSGRKHENTSISTTGDRLTEIDLAGTNMRLLVGGQQAQNR